MVTTYFWVRVLKFCPNTRSYDKIKLAEDVFKFARRLRLKEYFSRKLFADDSQETADNENEDSYTNLPFFNKSESTFTPPPGRDIYLDFYITAVREELLHSEQKGKHYSNISKNELESLRKLSQDQSIVIKKADKSNTIVIMNTDDYRKEVLRQLDDVTYY